MILEVISLVEVKLAIPILEIVQLLIITFSTWHFALFGVLEYPQHALINDGQVFDFIVVGAGTAGCVVANRLTEVTNWTVLLVEAGDDPLTIVDNPGISTMLSNLLPDWGYYTVDDGYSSQARKTRNNRQTMGKMIGGSSALNYMFYVRGNKADYEYWVDSGNDGWDWNTVTSYFKKNERLNDEDIMKSESAILHSTTGYLGVTNQPWGSNRDEFFEAVKEIGHNVHIDTNGFQQMGYSPAQFMVYNGERQSTAFAFIKPIKDRENLFIIKNTMARKIRFDDNRKADGVELQTPEGIISVYAKREVILSAGAINSPQLLMLSGVGPKEHLEEMQLDVVLDSPKVGENLQDHIIVPFMFTSLESISSIIYNFNFFNNLDSFPMPTVIGFAALNKSQSYPDYQSTVVPLPTASPLPTLFCSQLFMLDDHICMAISSNNKLKESVFGLLTFLHPESRGKVKLMSSDPLDKAIIHSGYFTNKNDLTKFARCLEDFYNVVNSSIYRSLRSQIVDFNVQQCMNLPFGSDEYWMCYVLNTACTQFHLVGTCAMGPEGQGVVDTRLKVHGLTGLRVVDASIMPTIISGNTNAPVIMIAEKASDMIKADNSVI